MPKPKTPKPESNSPFDRSGAGMRAALLFTVVAFLTIALVLVWKQLPKQDAQPSKQKPAVTQPVNEKKVACEAARGNWVECGNPCHGKPGEVCDAVCEPQCQCGGIAGFGCPKDLVCTDFEPPNVPDAMGICRTEVSEQPRPEPTTPVRAQPENTICDDRNFICVESSTSGTLLTSPFTIKGSGLAFENTINWRLLDANGVVLEQGHVMANAPDIGQAGDFEIRAFILTVPKTDTGTLEVLEYSAKDGSPIHVVKIPVRLPQQSMAVKIYLTTDAVESECSAAQDTQSIVRTNLPIEATVRKLLHPELGVGTGTSIPTGTELRSIKVSGGTATVVFSPELETGGGSCHVQSVRAQIEQTLKQFSSVRNVVISVEGKTPEETLQP